VRAGRSELVRQIIAAMRKDVTAKCYAGDISHKKKASREAEKG